MDSWERNVLGIADWTDPKWKLAGLVEYLTPVEPAWNNLAHHKPPEGDIVELGVYKGRSLLALALAFPDRMVWGYDSWEGLPAPTAEDSLSLFSWLEGHGRISREHYVAFVRMLEIAPERPEKRFDDASLGDLFRRAEFAGATNINLVEDWPPCGGPDKIAAASLDCDLYESYKSALPWVWERLVPNGYVHLDEYYSLKYPGARIAVDEWCEEVGIEPRMHERIPGEFERWYLVKDA